jgi:hypothetical protein
VQPHGAFRVYLGGCISKRGRTTSHIHTRHRQGNAAWTDRFRWDGHAAFRRARMVDWAPALGSVNNSGSGSSSSSQRLRGSALEMGAGARARGQYKSAHGLTFLTLYDAGHLAPMDAPAATLAMVRCVLHESVCMVVGLVNGPIDRLTRGLTHTTRQFTLPRGGGFEPTVSVEVLEEAADGVQTAV